MGSAERDEEARKEAKNKAKRPARRGSIVLILEYLEGGEGSRGDKSLSLHWLTERADPGQPRQYVSATNLRDLHMQVRI